MKEYVILKVNNIPDWNAVPVLAVDTILWEPDCGIRMTQQLCYDETALYVRQRAWEANIRAEYSAPLSPVHEDSCMEFFFAFGADGCYFNFEINPNACLELGFGLDRKNRVRLCHKAELETFRLRCVRTTDGWVAEYRLPLDFFRLFYPAPPVCPRCTFPRQLLQMRRPDGASPLPRMESGKHPFPGLPPPGIFGGDDSELILKAGGRYAC